MVVLALENTPFRVLRNWSPLLLIVLRVSVDTYVKVLYRQAASTLPLLCLHWRADTSLSLTPTFVLCSLILSFYVFLSEIRAFRNFSPTQPPVINIEPPRCKRCPYLSVRGNANTLQRGPRPSTTPTQLLIRNCRMKLTKRLSVQSGYSNGECQLTVVAQRLTQRKLY